jgi:DNA-binding NarL/FixJ family response regulator
LHSILVTDQPLVALGISQVLAAIDTRMRVSTAASTKELFNVLEEVSAAPALVVVDLATRGLAVEQLFIELPRRIGRVPLVALLDDADQVPVRALASAGATCVLKADSADALQAAVMRALTSRPPSAQPASMDSQG